MNQWFHLPPDLIVGPTWGTLEAAPTNWGMRATHIDRLRTRFGEGEVVAILDTGLDPDHPELGGRVKANVSFVPGESGYDGNGHGCVAPEDMVYTSLCGLKQIDYLFQNAPGIAHFVGECKIIKDVSRYGVFTLSADKEGNTVRSKVLAVHKLDYKGKVYKVRTGTGELTLTPWHPVYTIKSRTGTNRRIEKKRADQLKIGDSVLLSSKSADDIGTEVKLPYRTRWECVHCGHEARAGNSERCSGCNKYHWHEGPKVAHIQLDTRLAFWLGLVSSDGHLTKRQRAVDFTNKDQRIGTVYADLCTELFGVAPKVYQRKGSEVRTWRLNCDDAHKLAEQIGIPVGNKSLTLEVPDLITKSPRPVVMAFYAGMIEGDGNIAQKVRLRTSSQKLAEATVKLMHTLGVKCNANSRIEPKSGRPSWLVHIALDPMIADQLRVKVPPAFAHPPKRRMESAIKDITVEDYDGLMYDLTVEGTTNYVANGHIVSNTHCAGTAVGSTPTIGVSGKAKLLGGKCLSNAGSGSNDWIRNAIKWAIASGATVISMSIGGPGFMEGVEDLVQMADSAGIVTVLAAGNERQQGGIVRFASSALVVAAVDVNGRYASFSNPASTNAILSCAAPGVNITSAKPGGGYQTMSGTSMATPFVAGVVAALQSERVAAGLPRFRNADFKRLFGSRNVDAGEPGADENYGPGLIDGELLRLSLVPTP